ncbi:MAG: DUF3576 domain-containing protein [Geminicoccaceae bacterium]
MRSGSAWQILYGAIVLGLIGCNNNPDVEAPPGYRTDNNERIRDQYGTVWGGDEPLFQRGTGSFARQDGTDGGAYAGIGVNAWLWRASLETIDFLPLAQADPFGGVIITDWYSPPETPDERFKLNVYVLDTVLRADGIKVAVFRQADGENGWRDVEVDPKTATDIEDNILTRARELRIAAMNTSG